MCLSFGRWHRVSGAVPLAIVITALGMLAIQSRAQQGATSSPAPDASVFEASERCQACHNGLAAPWGEDISIGFDWRASMMANSSRDPYWHAGVRREVMDHPKAQAAIEDECSVCHMPMTRWESRRAGHDGEVFAHLPLDGRTPFNRLAADGVSCTVCHQIENERLGTRESFVGGFVIAPRAAEGDKRIYGPFAMDVGRMRVMQSATGFTPTESAHIQQSELCATCHTLITKALGPDAQVIGELPEQVPYLEWLHSNFRGEKSCQSCHMPAVADTAITAVLGHPRPALARHVFVGGNFFMQRLLNRYRSELNVTALPQEMDAAITRTIANLQTATATIAIPRMHRQGDRLEVDVAVQNLTGHKLPTGYPSRRAWIHLVVQDANDRVVFESGALNANGSITGNDNDADALRFEPHYAEIASPDQVQIYESVMVGPTGEVTTGLLTAVRFAKDNRLLPRGFDKAKASAEIAVHGEALADPDFASAGDQVRYAISVGGAPAPLRVNAELWYQPISFRWAENLRRYDAEEPRKFNRYYDSMSNASGLLLVQTSRTE